MVRQVLILGGAGLVTAIFYGIDAWWSAPSRRRARVRKWAERRLVGYEDQWLRPVEEQGVVMRRFGAIGLFFTIVLLAEIRHGWQPYAAWLLSVPALFAILCGIWGARPLLPPGTRVARLRELELVDYLPERTRQIMWLVSVCGFLACLLTSVALEKWIVGVAGLLMLAAPASVELAGRRLARMPEPAESAAHLYLQDALRADSIRFAAFASTQSGAMACIYLSMVPEAPDWLTWTLLALSPVLLWGLFIVAMDGREAPADYMRGRLWPGLKVGQVLKPGDALPTEAVRS